jgi:hypothetical protein
MEILCLIGFDVFQEHISGVKRDLPVIGEYQAGFRSAKATMDQIFTIKNVGKSLRIQCSNVSDLR